jgi:hypothetical protein
LLELAQHGEVMLLPAHESSPFNAVLVTRAKQACGAVADAMLDIEGWPSRFRVKEARVLERTATSVRYELDLALPMAPTVAGLIERPQPGRVVFNDVQTGAQFIWTLDDVGDGCFMRYSLLETPGKASGWVAVVRALEESAVDAANLAAAIGSARGFTKPERVGAVIGPNGDAAFRALAGHGTALRVKREGGSSPVVIARRIIARPVDEVLWSIRDKRRWLDKIDFFARVTDRGRVADYTVAAFGGRVSWRTDVAEDGDAAAGGLTIRETVAGGDLKTGSFHWLVRAVPGGTDVTLTWDLDVPAGSSVMTALASTDPIARESLALHMALALMGRVIGGKPLPEPALAQRP